MDNQHGGNITAFAKEIGTHPLEVIDLSSNINFVKPKIEFDFNALEISPYPNYDKLEDALARRYEIAKEEFELFNGATSAIYALFSLLKPQYATLYAPLYLEYEKALNLTQSHIEHINRFEDIYKEPKENSLVVFVNPSTPDGKHYDLDRLMKIWMDKNCTIVIDESFLDFTSHKSATSYIKEYSKLYILKSMTKFYSSAGVRIGVLISTQKNIQAIKTKEPLWKISEFDSHYLQEALKDREFKEISDNAHQASHKKLMEILEDFPYTDKIYPTDANFMLVKLKGMDAPTLQKKLLPHKIMIRNCSNFKFLDDSYVRIAIKSGECMGVLEVGLRSIST